MAHGKSFGRRAALVLLGGLMLVVAPAGARAEDRDGAGGDRNGRSRPTKQQERAAELLVEKEAQALRLAEAGLKARAVIASDPAKMEAGIEEHVRCRAELDLRNCFARWVARQSSEFERQQAAQPSVPGNPVREVDQLRSSVLEVRKVERIPGWMRVRVEGEASLAVMAAYGRWYDFRKLTFAAVYEIQPDWSEVKLYELTINRIAEPLE